MNDLDKTIEQIIKINDKYIKNEFTIEQLQRKLLSPDFYILNDKKVFKYFYSHEKTHTIIGQEYKKFIVEPLKRDYKEQFEYIDNSNIVIGNNGNMKNEENCFLKQYCYNNNGYPDYTIYVNFFGEERKIYNLIADAFCLKPVSIYTLPHHISNNAFDSSPENIIFVTPKQHEMIHASSLENSITFNHFCSEIINKFPIDLSYVNSEFFGNIRIHYTSLTFYFNLIHLFSNEVNCYKGRFIFLNDEILEIYGIENDPYGYNFI